MLFTINQIITWHDDEANTKWDERVLHIFLETGEVVSIDVKAKDAQPTFRSREDSEEEIRSLIERPRRPVFPTSSTTLGFSIEPPARVMGVFIRENQGGIFSASGHHSPYPPKFLLFC